MRYLELRFVSVTLRSTLDLRMELNPLGGSGLFTTRCSLPSFIVEVAAHRAGIETVTQQHFSNTNQLFHSATKPFSNHESTTTV